jgi:hypothetical protein
MAAIALLAALFLINCYRAATQSVVHDEALTWQLYLSGPVSSIFRFYDANNHFLATLLFRLSTELFGVAEFSMRVPTLLAGAWYFWSVFLLSVLVFEDGLLLLIAVGLLALNPILLDFLVAARGYGLAMAGLFWALLQMIGYLREANADSTNPQRARLWKAAAGLGVAFAANLTMLFPAVILAVLFGAVLRRKSRQPASSTVLTEVSSKKKRKKTQKRSAAAAVGGPSEALHFVLPLLLFGLVYFLAAPVAAANMQNFYVGTDSAIASLRDLTEVSFAYNDQAASIASMSLSNIWLWCVIAFLLTVEVAGVVTALRIIRANQTYMATAAEIAVVFTATTIASSAFLLALAHLLMGLPYPVDRTGLYFVPLILLCAVALLKLSRDRLPAVAWWAGVVICGVFILVFAMQMPLKSFRVWRYDADTERIFSQIEKRGNGGGPIRLGASWQLEPALNFYRVTRNASWLEPVLRDGFNGDRQMYVFIPADVGEMGRLGVKEVYRGAVSGSVLATR